MPAIGSHSEEEVKKQNDGTYAPRCNMCNAEKPSICGGCGASYYCSKECQKADWPLHKLLCKAYKPFIATRPNGNCHVGIGFLSPEVPSLVWIPGACEEIIKDSEEIPTGREIHLKTAPQLEHMMGGEYMEPKFWTGRRNLKRNFDLNPCSRLVVHVRTDYHVNQSPNACIMKLTKDLNSKLLHVGFWSGPIIVSSEFETSVEVPELCREAGVPNFSFLRDVTKVVMVGDANLADLRHAIDNFAQLPENYMKQKYPFDAESMRNSISSPSRLRR